MSGSTSSLSSSTPQHGVIVKPSVFQHFLTRWVGSDPVPYANLVDGKQPHNQCRWIAVELTTLQCIPTQVLTATGVSRVERDGDSD